MSGSNNSEELEEAINQSLNELGLLEDGMTLEDKVSLWEVIKRSKDTAQAEEKDRQKRAGRNLQFDEVSSRSDDGAKAEEKIPDLITLSPSSCSDSQDCEIQNAVSCNFPTSTSESSDTQALKAPASPIQRSQSLDCYNRDLPKHVSEPSARRSLRLKPNEPSSISKDSRKFSSFPEECSSALKKQNTPSYRNVMSPRNVHNIPSPGKSQNSPNYSNVMSPRNDVNVASPSGVQNSPQKKEHSITQKDQEKASSRKRNVGNSKPNSPSPAFSSQEKPQDDESPTASDGESSPINRIRKGFDLSLKFMPSEEDNEQCALNDKEKCETVPSPSNPSPSDENASSVAQRKVLNDRERNIDAFSCDRSNYELTLRVSKPRKMCSRLPFFIPPRKMDVHSYIAYFKKCVSEQAAKLLEYQKKTHKCVPWGDPVVVGEINSNSYVNADQENHVSTLQRYPSRRRRAISQKADTAYEKPNSQNEIDSQKESNDDFFDSLLDDKSCDGFQVVEKAESTESTKLSNVATPERQGSKRKSESSDEMEDKRSASGSMWPSTTKNEEEEVAIKRKKLETVCNAEAANVWEDLDIIMKSDEESSDIKPLQEIKRKRFRRKLYRRPKPLKEEADDKDDAVILDELKEVESASSSTKSEADVIRPAPSKLRRNGRRYVKEITKQEYDDSDLTVVYQTNKNDDKGQEMKVPCPICEVSFPAEDIEAHASECNEYCAERIPEDEDKIPSPQAPSQECWSQFDGICGSSTQGTTASKHSFGATKGI